MAKVRNIPFIDLGLKKPDFDKKKVEMERLFVFVVKFLKCFEMSSNVNKCPQMSSNFAKKIQKTSDFSKCPAISKNVFGCPQ